MSYLVVFVGAGIGGALRHGINAGSARLFGYGFPWGTLIVNVAGSLLIGLLAGLLAERLAVSQEARLFLGPGLLGGFTTFSAFSLDAVTLWSRGQVGAAVAYSAASVALSIAALLIGLNAARPGGF